MRGKDLLGTDTENGVYLRASGGARVAPAGRAKRRPLMNATISHPMPALPSGRDALASAFDDLLRTRTTPPEVRSRGERSEPTEPKSPPAVLSA